MSTPPIHRQRSRTSAAHGGGVPPSTSDSQAHCKPVIKCGEHIPVPGKLTPLEGGGSHRLTKMLVKVTIERSCGPVQVVMPPESTVIDLIKAAVEIYVKEKRRPLLIDTTTGCFQLHYSQFSMESLKAEDKLINLGSRNFFLCPKPSKAANSSCFDEAKKEAKSPFPFAKFMDFML